MISVEIKREVDLIDGERSDSRKIRGISVEPGNYELERIPNPLGLEGDWLVLKGTLVGQTAKAWANLTDSRINCAVIEEDIEI